MISLPNASEDFKKVNPEIFGDKSCLTKEVPAVPKGNPPPGKFDMKSERQLQTQIVNLLRLKGIEVLWHRTDKKSAATVGWPDCSFSVPLLPKQIPLGRYGNAGIALVSPEDFELVSQFRWLSFEGYAMRTVEPRVMMHRLVMSRVPNPESKPDIDHINKNGLDNRRENLRWATRSENCMNRSGVYRTSAYKGVCWDKERGKWAAFIKVDKKNRGLGRFDTEIEAARAYDHAAMAGYGAFAQLNFPINSPQSDVRGIPCVWEIKLPGRKLSSEQEALRPKLEANGWRYRVITSVDQALSELKVMGVT